MKNYRYTLEKYRGRQSRYVCPQCGRKYVFTRHIDTETNRYIADNVGKCSRLDKCGYHHTPREYFSDNPTKNVCHFVKNTGKMTNSHSQSAPQPTCYLPEVLADGSMRQCSTYMRWLEARFGRQRADDKQITAESLFKFSTVIY